MPNLTLGSAAIAVLVISIVIFVAAWIALSRRRQARRTVSLQHLLDLADRLEVDLKT